jgi:hypothetical protein
LNYSDALNCPQMTRKKKANVKLLKAEKEFTHQNARIMADELNGALINAVQTKITLTNISSVDLPAMQLIISARRSFEKGRVPLLIDFSYTEEIRILLENCGFGKLLNLNA